MRSPFPLPVCYVGMEINTLLQQCDLGTAEEEPSFWRISLRFAFEKLHDTFMTS